MSFFRRGIVEQPVVSSDHIQPFHDAGVDPLWVYHCCAQGRLVPNRFFAMPSARNRIMGVLLYLYHLKGLLQWGYNFYYTQFSRSLADPFAMTHCDYAFPSGDAYLVYPGPGGEPLSSLRAEVQSEGLTDLRASEHARIAYRARSGAQPGAQSCPDGHDDVHTIPDFRVVPAFPAGGRL